MARRRYLQPGFWQNPLLSKCPPLTRLFFEVLWTHADFDGVFPWEPDAMAMKGLPRDDFDAVEALERLERDGFVRRYTAGGKAFGYVVNWHKHQDPHPGEMPVYPRPEDDPEFIVKVKAHRWRKDGDTAFRYGAEVEPGCFPLLQLANNLHATCREVAGKLSATDKEGKEGKERPSHGNETYVGRDTLAGDPDHHGQESKPKATRAAKRDQRLKPFRPDVVAMVVRLAEVWPTERPKDGSRVDSDAVTAAANVELILQSHPDLTPDMLETAARCWLESRPQMPNAMQFFFGPGKAGTVPPWEREIRAQLTSSGVEF